MPALAQRGVRRFVGRVQASDFKSQVSGFSLQLGTCNLKLRSERSSQDTFAPLCRQYFGDCFQQDIRVERFDDPARCTGLFSCLSLVSHRLDREHEDRCESERVQFPRSALSAASTTG